MQIISLAYEDAMPLAETNRVAHPRGRPHTHPRVALLFQYIFRNVWCPFMNNCHHPAPETNGVVEEE